jgi:carbamoyl-phosphate synthase large subunit
VIGGVMQHVEEAGVHSGDSTSVLPPYSLSPAVVARIEQHTRAIALELGVVGLMNVQYAVRDEDVYVIEVNPRASRTVPFVSKTIGQPLAKIAAQVMVGKTLDELGIEDGPVPTHVATKESVFPFGKFPGVDTILGPEMRSTGEVMGIDRTFGMAFAKSQTAAGNRLPSRGTVFFSLADRDKPAGAVAARRFTELGYTILATAGTAAALEEEGLEVELVVGKLTDGVASPGLDAVELLRSGKVDLVVNTPRGRGPRADGAHIRRTATARGIPCVTTVAAALAASAGIVEWESTEATVRSLQEYHRDGQLRLEV